MKINIYYGGRGLVEDPTLSVINRMQLVFDDLHVTTERFNLFEMKNAITTLPESLKNADGIILATTVEWFGIGGLLQEFLDACWLYGDKNKIASLYMCPIVMSTTHGEQDGKYTLMKAWEILGGRVCEGLSGYIDDTAAFESNSHYMSLVEKKAENIYRTISQKPECLPNSNHVVVSTISTSKSIDLTPQESEQLSQYVADDVYVQTQKEDIRELSSLFKDFLGYEQKESEEPFIDEFQAAFHPLPGMKVLYKFVLEEKSLPLIIEVNVNQCDCHYGNTDYYDVEVTTTENNLEEILSGRKTFQRSFMAGEMRMKGDFKLLRALDSLFPTKES